MKTLFAAMVILSLAAPFVVIQPASAAPRKMRPRHAARVVSHGRGSLVSVGSSVRISSSGEVISVGQ